MTGMLADLSTALEMTGGLGRDDKGVSLGRGDRKGLGRDDRRGLVGMT